MDGMRPWPTRAAATFVPRSARLLWTGVFALGMAALYLGARCFNPLVDFERAALNPGLVSDLTPKAFGVPFEAVSIRSGGRTLSGWLVMAAPGCAGPGVSVLVFHGRGETVADWIGTQQYLRRHCVTSLVFDYSGHGHSTGTGTVENLNEDGLAATTWFMNHSGLGRRRCLLGHSMGNAIMLQAATRLRTQPSCIVLASPFASLREMALSNGLPAFLAFAFPDVWNNLKAAPAYSGEALWLHSTSDATVPLAAGKEVFSALRGPGTAVVVDGLSHNAIYREKPESIWQPIIAFLRAAPAAVQ